eukprot:191653_1
MAESSKWTYKWQITDQSMVQQMKNAQNQDVWTSPIFSVCGFRWKLQVFPNGDIQKTKGNVNFYVMLTCLPPKVKSISIAFSFGLIEAGKIQHSTSTYTKQNMAFGWAKKQLQTVKLQNLNTFTFAAKIELAGVFDKNDNDITNQYISHEESKQNQSQEQQQLVEARLDSLTIKMDKMIKTVQSLQQQMNNMQLRMNEDEKNDTDNNIDKLFKEVQSLKQTVNQLSLSNKLNPQQQKLKSWLENKCKLPQYFDVFIKNGIDEIPVV